MARAASARRREHRDDAASPASGSSEPRDPNELRDPAGNLDRIIHERTRLAIMSALAVQEPLGFTELKTRLGLTDGNLSVHARRLEEAGFIACKKRFEGRVPRTEYVLTAVGRHALSDYLAHMEALIRTMRESASVASSNPTRRGATSKPPTSAPTQPTRPDEQSSRNRRKGRRTKP